MNGTIGKQMVDTLVESAGNVEVSVKILNFIKSENTIPLQRRPYMIVPKTNDICTIVI